MVGTAHVSRSTSLRRLRRCGGGSPTRSGRSGTSTARPSSSRPLPVPGTGRRPPTAVTPSRASVERRRDHRGRGRVDGGLRRAAHRLLREGGHVTGRADRVVRSWLGADGRAAAGPSPSARHRPSGRRACARAGVRRPGPHGRTSDPRRPDRRPAGLRSRAGLGEAKGGIVDPVVTRLEARGNVIPDWRAGNGGPGHKYPRRGARRDE